MTALAAAVRPFNGVSATKKNRHGCKARRAGRQTCLPRLSRLSRHAVEPAVGAQPGRVRVRTQSSTQDLNPGRVPQVRQPAPACRGSVPGPDTIFFECFYSICDGVIGGMRTLEGLRPDFLCSVSASMHFMRLSLMKAAHAGLSSAACRKSGSPILFSPCTLHGTAGQVGRTWGTRPGVKVLCA
jgi:hypothetical protein